jgi:hypothetical protein
MRWIKLFSGLWAVALATLAGCALSESNQVKPPKPPEEFRAPPENEPRFGRPMEYPKDTMDQDALIKKAKDAAKGAPNPMKTNMTGPGARGGF